MAIFVRRYTMKYGFIGCGNMGGAIAKALAQSTKDILLSSGHNSAKILSQELACSWGDNLSVAKGCERIFLAVKPQIMESVLKPLAPVLAERKPLIITMAAGLEIKKILSYIGTDLPAIRIMPNTPVCVGKGVIPYCHNELVDEATITDFIWDMQHAGYLDRLDEKLMDAASALSGSGPAYISLFLEAMADGAVACGLPRQKAIDYAASTMLGTAQMLMTTKLHPGQLKDAVCSPGGSTIAGIQALEENSFRGTIMDCIIAAYQKNSELGK